MAGSALTKRSKKSRPKAAKTFNSIDLTCYHNVLSWVHEK
jgi:hypothetical protein